MMMTKDEDKVLEDVEEGEISDNASVEEISEAVFNKQGVNKEEESTLNLTSNSFTNPNSKSKPETTTTTTAPRVWTFQDLYKYQVKKGYTAGLHNLAWAQAVKKKPLSEVWNLDFEDENNNNNNNSSRAVATSSSLSSSLNNSKEENKVVDAVMVDAVVIDDDSEGDGAGEKEEGELEEGEIDLDNTDTNVVQTLDHGEFKGDNFKIELMDVDAKKINLHAGEVDKLAESIQEALEKIVQNISMISFEGACSHLLNSLDSIKEVELVNDFCRKKDGVAELFFSAIQAVYSEYISMNSIHRERNRGFFSRVLTSAKSTDASLFSTNQMKEMEEMVQSLNSQPSISDLRTSDGKETSVGVTGNNLLSSTRDSVEILKETAYSTKSRGILLPLLDLHKDHDEDDLPSPTREAPRLPFPKPLGISDGSFKPDLGSGGMSHGMEGIRLHPYQTDAVRAVSNYQQKFGRSMLSSDLPSPTPSEEHDGGVDDTGGEVSSSSKGKPVATNLPNLVLPSVPLPLPHIENANVQKIIAPASAAPPALVSNLPAKPSAKSRDPRLRFASPDLGNSDTNQRPAVVNNGSKMEAVGILGTKMHRNIEETAIDGPAVKRPRNGLENSGILKDVRASSGTSGWLGESDMAGSQSTNRNHLQENLRDPRKIDNEIPSKLPNLPTSENDAALLSSLVSAASLPALLKNIAVNPTMLMNLLKLGQQQKLVPEAPQNHVDPSKSTSNPANGSSILGAAPVVSVAPAVAPGILPKPAGSNQVPTQTVQNLQDEAGKIRMKPRDPRRILHSNPPHRNGSLGTEQSNNGSLPEVVPDIAQQFSKNLKDVADIVSASQASTAPVVVSQNLPSQLTQVSPVEAKAVVSSTKDQQAGSASTVEAGAAGLSHAQNSWGDVEHLFEGYDDQQRAAIQRERTRRIEEQKKMFAQRKLSLVLDLDHTLLNSAKFVEVDLVHEEILRKKEQEDKEKPQRHLFRFSHMGMWTKLRPGIWNFLEKASKLYELHLYTMGNKLYATEMAKVLDPKGTLFAGRVISRGDDGDPLDGDDRFKTKDLEGVLGMESGVVIIDDSVRVWPHNKLNLIVVERYTYFPCSRRQFGLLGPSLLEIDHDERPEEGTLASSLAVIEKIHQNFFSHQSLDDVDVRNILATEQRKILAGCRIVFSRVFPVGEANPHLHPLWQTAEQFGAVCTNQIDEQVTHVVANSLGTDKVNWALSKGRFVVHPGWVEASALLYRRANEQDFAIKP